MPMVRQTGLVQLPEGYTKAANAMAEQQAALVEYRLSKAPGHAPSPSVCVFHILTA